MCASLQRKGINDMQVLKAMLKVPRHWFLDMALDNLAYEDRALPIGCEQTISRPSTVAMQSQLLSVAPGMKVLEIGTGSGYQTSVLCEMGARVYTIERQQELFVRTKKMLYEMRYDAKCYLGDGYRGLTEIDLRPAARIADEGRDRVNHGIFDRIIITCGAPYIPEPLVHQLKTEGVMVIPVEERTPDSNETSLQMLRVVKHGNERDTWEVKRYGGYRFVPMLDGRQF
ncbi:MAG: protein-L-isoaspartate(D-aspartate) O-methyltransferase [bacterium P3]|nr:MAG: protein-L-isoaspartate(D-aspartate) O-methyltransferase [bacterium P3]KWW40755.1 MAG: protein-L-isoaspartate(D-aspartate) O-methyltransferase [bacterium F083]